MKLVLWGLLIAPVLAMNIHYNSYKDQDDTTGLDTQQKVSTTKARIRDEFDLDKYDNHHNKIKRENFGATNGYSVNYTSVYVSSGLSIAIQLAQGIRSSMRGTIETPVTPKTLVVAYYVL